MNPKPSLFVHTRPRVSFPKAKQTRGFLALPGEIRNRIYQYYFQDTYRCELVGEGCDLSTAVLQTIKLLPNTRTAKRYRDTYQSTPVPESPLIVRFSHLHRPNIGCRNTRSRVRLNPHGALVFVCKQMHAETLPLLYQRMTFIFEAPRRIIGFLHRIPKQNHNDVTKIHLHYTTYGSPAAACHIIWQEKHVQSWTRACKMASKSLTCLRELEIDVWINEDAPKFNLRQKWLQPLWQFRRANCANLQEESTGSKPRALIIIKVRVKTRLWAQDFEMNTRLANACKHLHRLYGHGISNAILGAKENEAMSSFEKAWNGKYKTWQHHLGFARTGW